MQDKHYPHCTIFTTLKDIVLFCSFVRVDHLTGISLGCFLLLTIVNNAVMKMGIFISELSTFLTLLYSAALNLTFFTSLLLLWANTLLHSKFTCYKFTVSALHINFRGPAMKTSHEDQKRPVFFLRGVRLTRSALCKKAL